LPPNPDGIVSALVVEESSPQTMELKVLAKQVKDGLQKFWLPILGMLLLIVGILLLRLTYKMIYAE
jgi:hypothetical protein